MIEECLAELSLGVERMIIGHAPQIKNQWSIYPKLACWCQD